MKTLILTITLVASATAIALAQGKKSVVIGTMIDRPNAVLVINPPNKDQGFLLPQLTSSERNNIAPTSPQDDGLVVYDVTDKSFYYWSGGSWVKGLGADAGTLTYNDATQTLTMGGSTVSLSTLKEIPSTIGQAGKYLTTDGTTLSWATLGALGDITSVNTGQALSGGATSGDINLAVNTDGTTISVNGSNQLQLSNNAVTSTKIAANAVNGSHIVDGSVTSTEILDNTITTIDIGAGAVTGPKIANGAVGPVQIATSGNNKVLTTDGAGAVNWADRSTFIDDNQNLTLAGNALNIDNGTGANLNNLTTTGDVAGALNAQVIQPGAVNSSKIQDGSIAPVDMATVGNDKVLTTDAAGVVNWADRSTFVDDNQNLTLAGNALNIDNGTGANLNNLTTSGDVAGALNAQVIQTGAVNSAKILDGSVAPTDLTPGATNQVMTTNAAGTATVWTTPGGDVTGPLNSSTVARLQGRDVSNTLPALNNALIWNGAAWAPGNAAAAIAPTVQYYAVDPANFQPMEPGSGTTTLGLFTSGGGQYVFAKGNSRQIMAAVNLPHGATIQSITVFYEYTLILGPMTINFDRKAYGGLNQILASVSPLVALGQGNTSMAPAAPDDVVDNQNYTYRIVVTFANLLDTNDANAVQRLHGIRIQYTK